MNETIPTPSTEFSNIATRRDIAEGIPAGEERKYNVLEAEEAAYAAKPFMDTATDLYDTYKSMDDFDYMENVVEETNLQSLVAYAEKRAYDAARTKNVPELTHTEKSVIEAFQAEKGLLKSQQAISESDIELSPDVLRQTIDIAYDRSKLTKDPREADKWQQMSRKLQRYSDYLENNDPYNREAHAEFSPNTDHASLLLSVGVERGELPSEFEHVSVAGIRSETRNMQRLTEMNNFLAELYPKSGEAETGYEAPAELHEPHYNVVETIADAKELIYSNPDYLDELIDESEAYAKFSSDKMDMSNAAITSNLKTMERDLPEVRQAVQDWRTANSGMSFKQYIEAIDGGDIEATQEQQNAVRSAKQMLRNRFWRESSMTRRMARKIADKSEVGDVDTAFGAGYFRS